MTTYANNTYNVHVGGHHFGCLLVKFTDPSCLFAGFVVAAAVAVFACLDELPFSAHVLNRNNCLLYSLYAIVLCLPHYLCSSY